MRRRQLQPHQHHFQKPETAETATGHSHVLRPCGLNGAFGPNGPRRPTRGHFGYQKCVAETVQRFGGFVAKYMGDGVLVYFGYPQAHEDDAERAVRAGLELVVAVGGLKTQAPLQTRVGIATGLVVVGDLIGSGASQEQAIVGRRRTLRRVCRALPSRTRSSLPKARASSWAICSSLKILAQRT